MTYIDKVMQDLMASLYSLDKLRRALSREEWFQFCQREVMKHPLHKVLLKDPFTRRSFENPSFFREDPLLIDMLFDPCLVNHQVEVAATIHQFIIESDPMMAIRHRRRYLVRCLDELAGNIRGPISILAVVPGHLREGELLKVIQPNNSLEMVVIDHPDRLFLLTKKFDLAYTPSLVNYLDDRRAHEVIFTTFEALERDGTVLFALFRQESPNSLYRTYMEAFMNWFMFYRTDEEIIQLFDVIHSMKIADFQLTSDPHCNITYVSVKKA